MLELVDRLTVGTESDLEVCHGISCNKSSEHGGVLDRVRFGHIANLKVGFKRPSPLVPSNLDPDLTGGDPSLVPCQLQVTESKVAFLHMYMCGVWLVSVLTFRSPPACG